MAASVDTINGLPGARFDNLFTVTAAPLAPHTAEEVEAAVYEEIDRLASEPVAQEELDRVRRRIETDFLRSLDSAPGLANTLAFFEGVAGDWRYLTRYTSVVESITPAEIMDVVKRRLTRTGRTVAVLRRPESR
jgi:predicted Zn-dependent peptidase